MTALIPNNDIKKQFFAQYWGLDVGRKNNQKNVKFIVNETTINDLDYIELNNLKSISDEEIIDACAVGFEVAFLGNCRKRKWKCDRDENGFVTVYTKYNHFSFVFDTEGIPLVDMYENYSNAESDLSNAFSNELAADYIRYLGYAVAWRYYSLDDLIKYQWLKITS